MRPTVHLPSDASRRPVTQALCHGQRPNRPLGRMRPGGALSLPSTARSYRSGLSGWSEEQAERFGEGERPSDSGRLSARKMCGCGCGCRVGTVRVGLPERSRTHVRTTRRRVLAVCAAGSGIVGGVVLDRGLEGVLRMRSMMSSGLGRRWLLVALAVVSISVVALVAAAVRTRAVRSGRSASSRRRLFHVWKVPAGVTRVTFDVFGAQGGSVVLAERWRHAGCERGGGRRGEGEVRCPCRGVV